jgi:hypothetical protein
MKYESPLPLHPLICACGNILYIKPKSCPSPPETQKPKLLFLQQKQPLGEGDAPQRILKSIS